MDEEKVTKEQYQKEAAYQRADAKANLVLGLIFCAVGGVGVVLSSSPDFPQTLSSDSSLYFVLRILNDAKTIFFVGGIIVGAVGVIKGIAKGAIAESYDRLSKKN